MTRPPGPVKGGATVIAFVKDPTGYTWELIERKGVAIPEPVCQVMLRVTDLDASVAYYRDALGMTLLRKRENEQYSVREGKGVGWRRAARAACPPPFSAHNPLCPSPVSPVHPGLHGVRPRGRQLRV